MTLGQTWTPVQISCLRSMWAEGATATQIGAEIGLSRSAVCGQARRLRLASRSATPVGPEVIEARRMRRKALHAASQRRRRHEVRAQASVAPSAVEPPPYLHLPLVPFAGLSDYSGVDTNQCRFIEGEASPWLCCGNATLPGASYCGHHHGIVYHKRGAVPELSDDERARRRIQALKNNRQKATTSTFREARV